MKKCFKCEIEKPLSDYYKHKQMLDGHLNKCKDCTKQDTKNNSRAEYANEDSYSKTKKGVIRTIYKTQVQSSKKRGHDKPKYDKQQLANWMLSNGFDELYERWVKSGYNKDLKPSIDRIDDFDGYSFVNIRLGTWRENKDHQADDITNGTGTSGRRCKAVECYKDGVMINKYHSYSEAARQVGYSFDRVLKSGNKDGKNGYIWRYC